MRYRRKPLEVEAVMWTGDNLDEIKEKISEDARVYNGCLFIGDIMPNRGDMVVKDEAEKVFFMKFDAFSKMFENFSSKEVK